jgi:peptidyl-prolyl cis-trans isomerase A (cyclophilin A)
MILRLLTALLLATPALTQPPEATPVPAPILPAPAPVPSASPTPAPLAPPAAGMVRVAIATSLGPVTVDLARDKAPKTVANFLRYVDARRFDGTAFYRAMKLGENIGLVQGGVRNRTDLIFPPVAHEPTSVTGLTHDDGAISLARAEPGSGRGDFFIMIGAVPTLDANPAATGDKLGYAVFGHVVAGMDVIRRILVLPTSPTAGGAAMRGQILMQPVKILSVKRLK